MICGGRPRRRVPDGPLRVPPLLHRLHRRAVGVRARALPRAPRQGGPALDALDGRHARRCSRLIGGFLQFAPLWHPLHDLARPGRAPVRRADERAGVGDLRCSRSPSASPASSSRGCSTRRSARRCRSRSRCFEKKFYWDELYDLVWYRTGDLARARPLRVRRAAADRRLARRGHRRRRPRLA